MTRHFPVPALPRRSFIIHAIGGPNIPKHIWLFGAPSNFSGILVEQQHIVTKAMAARVRPGQGHEGRVINQSIFRRLVLRLKQHLDE